MLCRGLAGLLIGAAPALAADGVVARHEAGRHVLSLETSDADDPHLLDLVIQRRSADGVEEENRRYRQVFWAGQANEPYFETLPTGAIAIGELGCFACGPLHDMRHAVIDLREGRWLLIGYTESWIDRYENWRGATCDVNLATSRAEIQLAEDPSTTVPAPDDGVIPLADLTAGYRPAICALTDLSDEEWQALKPAGYD